MPDRTKEYLAKARWCEQQANEVGVPETRRVYLELARGWREFAAKPLIGFAWPIEGAPLGDDGDRDSIRELQSSSS